MNAELFSKWLGAVRMLTRDQRRETFMRLALSEADDDPDGALSEAFAAVNAPAVAGAPMAIAPPQPDDAQSPSAALTRPMGTDGLADELAAAARSRVAALGCPHCDAKEVRPWGHAHGLPRYRCTDRRRTFNALSGTPLARLRHKGRWPDQAQALMTAESVSAAATRCGVAYTTAFRWRHRFLAAPALDKPTCLNGIVEADEHSSWNRYVDGPGRCKPYLLCCCAMAMRGQSRPKPFGRSMARSSST